MGGLLSASQFQDVFYVLELELNKKTVSDVPMNSDVRQWSCHVIPPLSYRETEPKTSLIEKAG